VRVHLQHALERLLAKEAGKRPSEELAELRDRAEGALAGPSFWRPFVRAARALENDSLDRWIAVNGPATRSSSLGGRLLLADRRKCP
jgi:hypothetical protein